MLELGVIHRLAVNAIETLVAAWSAVGAEDAADALHACGHGDLPRWMAALARLPEVEPTDVSLGDTVGARSESMSESTRVELNGALRDLIPWRKGPFHLFGIDIHGEWRSDMKWARIAPHMDLHGCRILDVGCGNGYYGWRMLEAGARSVTGVDPSPLATLQHAAIAYYLERSASMTANTVLPLRVEDFEARDPFDVVFSMGVVYHRRDPAAHVRRLARFAHPRTTVVLESLVVDGGPLEPRDRYARMRNVWLVPDVETLADWLRGAGFASVEVVDVRPTTTGEQRTTDWMPFGSLREALDPTDATLTIEGYPAPKRAVMIARRL